MSAGGRRTDHPPRGCASERVAETLRRAILSGYLPSGTRLVQPKIAEALGVGSTPVREAVRQLVVEGLVRMGPAGAVVHELSRSELVEVYEVRKLLEPIAVARAASEASEESLVAAIELLGAMESVESPAVWSETNARFHELIVGSSGSPRLCAILRQLHGLSALYVTHSLMLSPERIAKGNAEHREILEAVITGASGAAADAVVRHLEGTLRTLLQLRELDADDAPRPPHASAGGPH